ncbi:MAG: acylneuraminate cytidylyltransferase family protein [Sandaracinus sp.]
MPVLAIVPARAGSKRIPDKNLRPVGGVPLVVHAFRTARAAKTVDRVVCSSDDPRVLALAAAESVTPIERPAELAGDASPAIDYVRHCLGVLDESGFSADVVVILQPTSPFTTSADVDATVDLLHSSGAESAVSVVKLDHAIHPVKLKRMVGDHLLPYLEDERGRMATHELPELYVRNCSVYVTRRSVIERGQLLSDDCRGYVMPRERSIDINDPIDLELADWLWSRRRS